MTDLSIILVTLRKLDKAKVVPRDVLVLESVRENPGSMGRETATRLGLASRSTIQDNIRRLVRYGLLDDRRKEINQRTPNDLHITPAGEKFLDGLVPQHDL